jgi:hypothetical protein
MDASMLAGILAQLGAAWRIAGPLDHKAVPSTGKGACDLREPPIGIEPMTYSLRVRALRLL